jgi:hypothetical protein
MKGRSHTHTTPRCRLSTQTDSTLVGSHSHTAYTAAGSTNASSGQKKVLAVFTCAPAAFAAATAATTASLGPRSKTCAASGGTTALPPAEPAACSLTGGRVCMLLISMRTPLTCNWQMGKVRPKTRGLGSSCFTCNTKGNKATGRHVGSPYANLQALLFHCAVHEASQDAPW